VTPKITLLRALMARGDWRGAIAIAARFPRLGPARDAVLAAREAFERPEFQRQIGRDPAAIIEAGKAALRGQYGHD
jgi:hypothetical protein